MSKAVVFTTYGADVLHTVDTDPPQPGPGPGRGRVRRPGPAARIQSGHVRGKVVLTI